MLARSMIPVVAALAATVDGQAQVVRRATTTSTAPATTWTVEVGAAGFKFSPNQVTAAVGDTVEFRLYPGNHTVARSDFGTPCLPYEYTGLNRTGKGFFSGYIGPQVLSSDLPKFQVRVNDTAPLWFYCTAPGSCFQHQMIGVINPNSTETLDLQQQYAINATYQLAPDDPFPSETLNPTVSPSATGAGAAAGGNSGDHDHHGLSAGAIAGIAIGGAAVLMLAGALVFLCGRRGGFDMAYRRSTHTFPPTPMVEEHKYNSHNPKSPGQQTFSTAHYSVPAANDPYRGHSPHAYNSSPPPMTPSHPAYSTYSSSGHPNVQSPLMAGSDGTQGYYPSMAPSPAEIQAHPYPQPTQPAPPVELPTSADPGNSPLPGYQAQRTYSWHQGQETQYRPGSKA